MRSQIHARSNEYPTGTFPIREGPGPRAARIQRTRHVDTRVDIHTTRALRARQTTLRCIQRRGRISAYGLIGDGHGDGKAHAGRGRRRRATDSRGEQQLHVVWSTTMNEM